MEAVQFSKMSAALHRLTSVTSYNILILIDTAVRTSNLAYFMSFLSLMDIA
jgi:hypothetical protein